MEPWTNPEFLRGFVGAMLAVSVMGTFLGLCLWELVAGLVDLLLVRLQLRPRRGH